jgi:integrase
MEARMRDVVTGQIICKDKKKKNKWLVRIFLGTNLTTGKREFLNKIIHGTKKDAEDYRTEIFQQRRRKTFVKPTTMTLNTYLDEWLPAARTRLRERTYASYVYNIDRYIRPALGNYKLSDLDSVDVQKLYASMLERGLSPRTVRYTHCILSSALKKAVRLSKLAKNPCELAELPKPERKEMRALSPEEAQQFLQAAAKRPIGPLFALALITGLRPSEYLALQWKDLDLDNGLLTVQRSIYWPKGETWRFTEPKTARSRRSMPLPASLIADLKSYKATQGSQKLKLGDRYEQHDLVFATKTGAPMHWRNVIHYFKEILRVAGLPKAFRCYDLRHSTATLLLSANLSPKIVAERLGHNDVSLTLNVYSHVLPGMQQQASDELERILKRK